MTIGVDGNEANVREKVGVSVYAFELLQYFHANVSKHWNFVVYLRNNPRPELPKKDDYFHYKIVKGPTLWRDFFLPAALYLDKKPDVFLSPAHYTPRSCPVPLVVTIHDLSYLYYPEEFLKKDLHKLTNWTKHGLKHSKKIIAVSKHTKDDIIRNYNVKEGKIAVVHNGYKKVKTQKSTPIKSGSKSKIRDQNLKKVTPYILYVGTLQPRKNITTLIEAFKLVREEKSELKLVVVGKRGWMYEEIFQKVKDAKLQNEVVFTGYLSDEEVSNFYKNAAAFVLPSLYEGFGIPILEAMSHDCPVIASNTSSLPEVGGNACLYFDPNDTIELKKTMLRVINDDTLRGKLIQKGSERVRKFSWERCGRKTLEILKSTTMSS